MPSADELYHQLRELPRAEKKAFIRRLGRYLLTKRRPRTPGIERTPGVCGGSARVRRTRIPVWTLVRLRQLGETEANILGDYPSLRAADLARAWRYAKRHPEEIERDIRENDEE